MAMDAPNSVNLPTVRDKGLSRLCRLPPLEMSMDVLENAGVSGDFVSLWHNNRESTFVDYPLDDGPTLSNRQPKTFLEEHGMGRFVNTRGEDDYMWGFFEEANKLSKQHLEYLVVELFRVLCTGLCFRRPDNKISHQFSLPKQRTFDTLQAFQAVFVRFFGDTKPSDDLFEKWSEWQQKLSPSDDIWDAPRSFNFSVWDFDRGYADQSTQTEPDLSEFDSNSFFSSPTINKTSPSSSSSVTQSQQQQQQPSPHHADSVSSSPISSSKSARTTSFVTSPMQSATENSDTTFDPTQTSSGHLSVSVLETVPETPELGATEEKNDVLPRNAGDFVSVFSTPPAHVSVPHLIFKRVRNAHEVSNLKLTRQWDAILSQIYGNESIPSVLKSENIRRVSSVGKTGVSITFIQTPQDGRILSDFFRRCESQNGQSVLQSIFVSKSTIGAEKFDPNFTPSPPRRVGNQFFRSPPLRETFRKQRFYNLRNFDDSPIRPQRFFSSRPRSSPNSQRQRSMERETNRPSYRNQIERRPRNPPPIHQLSFQLNALQQQINSVIQIQQQMAQSLQHLGLQMF